METIPALSVFTPAYNRAHTIGRTYESLLRQTSMDFKWVIVDDGSTDDTEKIVRGWMQKENPFKIEYYWKENGGMHSAHNVAYEHMDTELAVCIDSDDWMPDNGVELILARWRKYGGEAYAGMVGLDIFDDGYVIGTAFPKGLTKCKSYDMGPKYHVYCDKKFVYRTEVMKKYLPYPVFPGEKFGTVCYLYQVIDYDYDLLCSNDVYCIVEYQSDGLSLNRFKQIKQSPRTRAWECNVEIKYQKYFILKFKRAIQYVYCSYLCRNKKFIAEANDKFLVLLAIPFAIPYGIFLKRKGVQNIDVDSVKFVKATDL